MREFSSKSPSPDPETNAGRSAADEFLAVASQFQLGELDTERPHPKTRRLSQLAQDDLPAAVELLREVDRDALAALSEKREALVPLAEAIGRTIASGKRIFLCGCGATGRLSLSLEIFAREGLLSGATGDNVIAFMAGGDAALIRSIEHFEDRPEFGRRQLEELGFADGDLLISSTEGGETPFVIGATEAAAESSSESPYFLYCNPDGILASQVERSRRVLENPAIRKIDLAVGPMALSGSTRMQASTVLEAAIGFAMKHSREPAGLGEDFEEWRQSVWACDWSFLADFVEAEAELYREGGYVLYSPGPFAITVLTDTTERSPTFSLAPFERQGTDDEISLCSLRVPGAASAAEAWRRVLGRDPRPLEWGELRHLTGAEAIRRFDLSGGNVLGWRLQRTPPEARHEIFRIGTIKADTGADVMEWYFRGHLHLIAGSDQLDSLGSNLLLKMLLNAHSTLVMGRLGRYEDNLMTYVSASNFKLIDRAARYIRLLLERRGARTCDYETVVRRLLAEKERLALNDAIVLKTVEALLDCEREPEYHP